MSRHDTLELLAGSEKGNTMTNEPRRYELAFENGDIDNAVELWRVSCVRPFLPGSSRRVCAVNWHTNECNAVHEANMHKLNGAVSVEITQWVRARAVAEKLQEAPSNE